MDSEQVVSFVVRFYGEVSKDRRRWRGQVEYVQTGEKRPFRGAEQFLRELESLSSQGGERSVTEAELRRD